MSIGGSQPMVLRFRVPLLALLLPVVLVFGVLLLGHGAARATQLLVHQPLTLHGGPGTAFSVLATLSSGTKVEVLWCNAQASWCLVENGDIEGWAPRAELITHDASSTRPTDGASPAGADVSHPLTAGADGPAVSIVGRQTAANSDATNTSDPPVDLSGAAISAAVSPSGISLSLSAGQQKQH